ncbi:MAG: o-succinylbenzoate synthase [Opitutales bacterium]
MAHNFDSVVNYKPYARRFRTPLQTARGLWTVRRGFIVRIERNGRAGFGEVAPLPESGTETMPEAEDCLRRLAEGSVSFDEPGLFKDRPCCAFGVSGAIRDLVEERRGKSRRYEVAALLPAGNDMLEAAASKRRLGYRVFKWKIGVLPADNELQLFRALQDMLSGGERLRLDANGGLSEKDLARWLELSEAESDILEYIEQPLPPGKEGRMSEMATASGVPIALDESLHGPDGWRWLKPGAWPGPLAIKPALGGDWRKQLERLTPVADLLVFSSAFETPVGLIDTLALADALPLSSRAFGFDTLNACTDDFSEASAAPRLSSDMDGLLSSGQIWNQLHHST